MQSGRNVSVLNWNASQGVILGDNVHEKNALYMHKCVLSILEISRGEKEMVAMWLSGICHVTAQSLR